MKEIVLRHFLEGHATIDELRRAAAGMRRRDGPEGGPWVYRYDVLPMEREFELRTEHLLKLVEEAQRDSISTRELEDLSSWLEGAVDRFVRDTDTPDGERVAEALFLLANPDINYPLTPAVLGKIHHYLATGENTLTRADTKWGSSTGLSNDR
jgi:hypothetical protein